MCLFNRLFCWSEGFHQRRSSFRIIFHILLWVKCYDINFSSCAIVNMNVSSSFFDNSTTTTMMETKHNYILQPVTSFHPNNQVDPKNISVMFQNNHHDHYSSRIYLVKGNLNQIPNNSDSMGGSSLKPVVHSSPSHLHTSVHIYFIFFIGFMPACIGAFAWWIQNRCFKNKCMKQQQNDEEQRQTASNHMNNNRSKLYSTKRYDDNNNKVPISHLRSGGCDGIVQSRPVYPFEVPRKCLDLIEILGEGNFGQVWKARSYNLGNKESSQLVAVKTNKLTGENHEQQEDLLKELDIMVQLGSHPNVVRLLGCCTENKPYYIVMEFVSQGKLLSYLRRHRDYMDVDGEYGKPNTKPFINNNNNYMTYYPNKAYGYSEINRKSLQRKDQNEPLTPYDLIHFAYQISKGMEFISSHGIIHRDLAVRNILIDDKKNCKVADFGLSRSIRDKDCDLYEMKHGGQVPVRWMSPEALTMGIFSIKSDVWAFGIVLWEIVTLGSTPYIGMSAPEVINYIRQGNICIQPEHCNDDLYDLMKSCWAYKADDRFTFTQIKYHLMKMLLAIQEDKNNYIDLENFNDSLYYFNTNDPSDEKL